MDTLTIIAVINMILWAGIFVTLWWVSRAAGDLEVQMDALEKRLSGE